MRAEELRQIDAALSEAEHGFRTLHRGLTAALDQVRAVGDAGSRIESLERAERLRSFVFNQLATAKRHHRMAAETLLKFRGGGW